MITIRKLKSLPEATRNRKILRILEEAEIALIRHGGDSDSGLLPDIHYLRSVVNLLTADTLGVSEFLTFSENSGNDAYRRAINTVRHGLACRLGQTPADWDFIDVTGGNRDVSSVTGSHLDTARFSATRKRTTFPMQLYLDDIRSPFNVGAIFRTAEAFGVCEILYSAGTAAIDHPRTHKTARGTTQIISHRQASLADITKLASLSAHAGSGVGELSQGICTERDQSAATGTPIFALETGGTPLAEFQFPQQSIMVIGSEELGVSPELLTLARESAGVVTIPMAGLKGSLNVSAAFAIVMERWFESLSKG